jgi:hypothetical protein
MVQDSDLIKNFTELFGFSIYDNSDVIFVKRIIAIFSGAILPVISLCFLHLLMSYLINSTKKEVEIIEEKNSDNLKTEEIVVPTETSNIEPLKEPVVPQLPNSREDEFIEHLKMKKEKIEKDRINYIELLKVLYKNGEAQKDGELPNFKEFVEMVDSERYNTDTIKTFLTLCNYLSITRVSKDQKIALMSYEDAKSALDGYLSLGNI